MPSRISPSFQHPTFTNTAVFVDQKKLPFAGYSVVKDLSGELLPPNPRRTCFARAPGHHQCIDGELAGLGRVPAPRTRFPDWPTAADRTANGQRHVVENTGLEPVTSWLQTRRSPS